MTTEPKYKSVDWSTGIPYYIITQGKQESKEDYDNRTKNYFNKKSLETIN